MKDFEYLTGKDCAPTIRQELEAHVAHGGRCTLPNREYDIHSPVVVDASSLCFCGEVWACNTDPNGVFETDHGTKLRMRGRGFPAIRVGERSDPISGAVVKDLGVQGDIAGMDTRPLVDFSNPEKNAGLCLDLVRTCSDFSMPSYDPDGKPLSPPEFRQLQEFYRPQSFFSPQLCCKYFTYRKQNGSAHFVLFDDEHTAAQKLSAIGDMGISHVFLLYSEWGKEAKSLLYT